MIQKTNKKVIYKVHQFLFLAYTLQNVLCCIYKDVSFLQVYSVFQRHGARFLSRKRVTWDSNEMRAQTTGMIMLENLT